MTRILSGARRRVRYCSRGRPRRAFFAQATARGRGPPSRLSMRWPRVETPPAVVHVHSRRSSWRTTNRCKSEKHMHPRTPKAAPGAHGVRSVAASRTRAATSPCWKVAGEAAVQRAVDDRELVPEAKSRPLNNQQSTRQAARRDGIAAPRPAPVDGRRASTTKVVRAAVKHGSRTRAQVAGAGPGGELDGARRWRSGSTVLIGQSGKPTRGSRTVGSQRSTEALCRNIPHRCSNFVPPVTEEEIEAASLQIRA
jgi:hypothetical protein